MMRRMMLVIVMVALQAGLLAGVSQPWRAAAFVHSHDKSDDGAATVSQTTTTLYGLRSRACVAQGFSILPAHPLIIFIASLWLGFGALMWEHPALPLAPLPK